MFESANRNGTPLGESSPGVVNSSVDFARLFGMARRNLGLIVLMMLVGLGFGLIHIRFSEPTYTATSSLFIDSRKVRALQNAYVFARGEDQALDIDLDSQIEVLRSEEIAAGIVDKLNLAVASVEPSSSRTARDASEPSLGAYLNLNGLLEARAAVAVDPEVARSDAIREVQNGLQIARIPRTAVLEISYTTSDPARAAKVANAVADVYIEYQVRTQKEAARRATNWLNEQLADLRRSIQTVEQAIHDFKTKRKVINSEGRLVEEQRLSEANRELIAATNEVEKLETRHQHLQAILNGEAREEVATEFYADPFVSQLRSRYITLVSNEQSYADRLGPDHEAIKRLRAQKAEYERLMRTELERIAKSVRSDLTQARARLADVESRFSNLATQFSDTQLEQVELRELQRSFDSYQKIYVDVLERHQSTLQQQTFDSRNASVITHASVPTRKNGPTKAQTLAFALILGAGLGGALGFARELADRTFRTRQQVRDELGQASVWMLPLKEVRPSRRRLAAMRDRNASPPGDPKRVIRSSAAALHYALDDPTSHVAETLEAIKLDLDRSVPGKKTRYLGVASVLPGEGRLNVSAALGELIARTGAKTLLIDGNLKNAGLTKLLAPDATDGLIEATRGEGPLSEHLHVQPGSGLRLLPAVNDGVIPYTGDFLASSQTKNLLARAGEEFDYVVVDLPAMGLHTDVRAITERLDAIILVVAWGQTPSSLVKEALNEADAVGDKCLGVVLTLPDLSKLKNYESADVIRCYQRRLPM